MRKKNILKIINQNKLWFATFSIIFSILIVIGSTYSWITYSDEKINQVKTNQKHLSASINETFKPNLAWNGGETTEKILKIKNNGQIPAIVRVSLFESIAKFVIDMDGSTGNASIKTVSTSSGNDMTLDDIKTWKKGSTYKVSNSKYYIAESVMLSDTKKIETATEYMGERNDILKYLTIQFNDKKIYDKQTNKLEKNYWYFDNGYFYFSEILQPSEETEPLIQSVTIDGTLPNMYKGSFYQLIPAMDAHDSSKYLLEDWGIVSNKEVKKMYEDKLH